VLERHGHPSLALVGHSLGGIVALEFAATEPGLLSSVAVAGVPIARDEVEADRLMAGAAQQQTPGLSLGGVARSRARYFGPPDTFDERVIDTLGDIAAAVPAAEFADGALFHRRFWQTAPQISIPVQFCMLEHENASVVTPALAKQAASAFTASPYTETHLQRWSGHNVSLHHVARSYHLRVLAFVEQCFSVRSVATTS
jgi:pimeloyl-ACP methyl ester carboxylesterase